MAYTTQPGTIPHRVVEYFKKLPAGAERTSAAICEDLDIDVASLIPCMEGPLKYGVMVRRKIPGERAQLWSLGDGKPLPADPDEAADAQRVIRTALAPAAPPAPVVKAARNLRDLVEFDAWLSTRGTLRLQGVPLTADGMVVLTPEQTTSIKRLLAWSGAC